MRLFDEALAAITAPDHRAGEAAAHRLDRLTKPQGSLGYLEEIVRRFAAIRHDPAAHYGRGALTVFVADHGVADAGVSAYPKAVTIEMLRNIAAGGAAISVMARRFGFDLIVTDMGVACDTSVDSIPGVHYQRVAAGTRNFLEAPAMSSPQARQALESGIKIAQEAIAAGATLIGVGEMGIGNSTSAAALLSAMTGLAPALIAGRGTGVDDAGLRHKLEVIEAGLARHHAALGETLSALAALGGFEIAAIAGVCLGAAARHVPVVIDGFIATAAAAIANRMHPELLKHLFFSHCSAEGGHRLTLETLGARPMLDLGMRLGEGTGAALAMNLIETALALYHEMATFETAQVSGRLG
ncbi:MAG: nicotinate-nucleotide--dimethylbenzimidazole phosphoribosyltransferase [Candidatus Binataceae bacterium]